MTKNNETILPCIEEKIVPLPSIIDNYTPEENIIDKVNFEQRVIEVFGEINQEMANDIVGLIRYWNYIDKINNIKDKPIYMLINSEGGNLEATLSIVAAIEISESPICTVNIGRAWSGGFLILISGSKRLAFPHATYLFHEGMNSIEGDAHKVVQQCDFYKMQITQIESIVLKNTSITQEKYNEHKKDDWWFLNGTALCCNIINKVIENINEIGV